MVDQFNFFAFPNHETYEWILCIFGHLCLNSLKLLRPDHYFAQTLWIERNAAQNMTWCQGQSNVTNRNAWKSGFFLQPEMVRSQQEIRKTPWFSSGNGEAFGLGHISFESLRESRMPDNFVADRCPNQDRRRLSLYCLRGGKIKIKKSSIGEKFAKMHLLLSK